MNSFPLLTNFILILCTYLQKSFFKKLRKPVMIIKISSAYFTTSKLLLSIRRL